VAVVIHVSFHQTSERRLLLLQRGEQTVSMRAAVDLDAAVWTKPRRKMKREKGAGPHAVALPPTALAILRDAELHRILANKAKKQATVVRMRGRA